MGSRFNIIRLERQVIFYFVVNQSALKLVKQNWCANYKKTIKSHLINKSLIAF